MKPFDKTQTDQYRREFVLQAARTLLGVSVLPLVPRNVTASLAGRVTQAKSVIYFFMDGGMSHIDTLDPKPKNRKVQGPVDAIQTSVPGLQLTEYLPNLAERAAELAVIRSLHHTMGNHEQGMYKVWTGYQQQTGLIHPGIGSWISLQSEQLNRNLPKYVKLGGLAGHPLNGFLENQHAPLPITSPEAGLKNVTPRGNIEMEEYRKNVRLIEKLDRGFREKYGGKSVRAHASLYENAVRMMTSQDLAAFDISQENKDVREKYGDHPLGSGALLARRLVEKGVRFIEITYGGFDTHIDNHKALQGKVPPFDRVLGTLIDDLKDRGLLESTLIVATTEFGRSPKIDQNSGRNHYPIAYSSLLAGGGIQTGLSYGETSDDGASVVKDLVTPWDFNATIAHAMGVDYLEMHSPRPGGQLFSIAGKDTQENQGRPIAALF